jgi:hypothetical protein
VIKRGSMNRALFALLALLASVIVGVALAESTEPTRIRVTTWNLDVRMASELTIDTGE